MQSKINSMLMFDDELFELLEEFGAYWHTNIYVYDDYILRWF